MISQQMNELRALESAASGLTRYTDLYPISDNLNLKVTLAGKHTYNLANQNTSCHYTSIFDSTLVKQVNFNHWLPLE